MLLKCNTLQHNLTYLVVESEIAYFFLKQNFCTTIERYIISVLPIPYDTDDKLESIHPCSRKKEWHCLTCEKKIVGTLKHIFVSSVSKVA